MSSITETKQIGLNNPFQIVEYTGRGAQAVPELLNHQFESTRSIF